MVIEEYSNVNAQTFQSEYFEVFQMMKFYSRRRRTVYSSSRKMTEIELWNYLDKAIREINDDEDVFVDRLEKVAILNSVETYRRRYFSQRLGNWVYTENNVVVA